MANKNHPGPFNCHAAALPDEPLFTILARDPAAPNAIRAWRRIRRSFGKDITPEDISRLAESEVCASEMRNWRKANLDPTGDGIPSWKLPRNQVDEDERPDSNTVRVSKSWLQTMAFRLRRNSNSVVHDLLVSDATYVAEALELAAGIEDLPCDCEASLPGNSPPHSSSCSTQRDIYQEAADKIMEPRIEHLHKLKERSVGRVAELGMGYGKSVFETEMDRDEDLAEKPDVPPHRFAVMHKGERYAYAKGLEVSPIHLPKALDAMAESGWHLLAIFGQTDSQHIGFIFERRPEPVYIHSPIIDTDFVRDWTNTSYRPQSDQMDAYESGKPLSEIEADLGRGLEP